mgnify:CR=1 FL=1
MNASKGTSNYMNLSRFFSNRKLVLVLVVSLIGVAVLGMSIRNKVLQTNEALTSTTQPESPTLETTSTTSTDVSGNPQGTIQTPTPTQNTTVAIWKGTGNVVVDGKTTVIRMTMPKNRGAVSGTTTGYCQGNISGSYDKTANSVTGATNGSCTHYGIPISSTGTFAGSINLDAKNGSGTFSGTGGQYTRNGTWQIVLE